MTRKFEKADISSRSDSHFVLGLENEDFQIHPKLKLGCELLEALWHVL